MPRLNIWIDAMKLARIDRYCAEHKLKRSTLLTRGALSIVNAQPIPRCDYCMKPSIGRYGIQAYDWNVGDINVSKYLCTTHLTKAQGESEVKPL